MHIVPLVERELRVALRRPSTRRLRLGFGAGAMAAVIWAMLVWGTSFASAGAVLFNSACLLASVLILFAAVFIGSDSIARERREGTLGFLYLTSMDALDVVAGKFAAGATVPFFTLLAMFPALAICQLLGGVLPGEFWRAILVLLLTLAFSLSATVFASSLTAQRRTASLVAALLLVTFDPLWLWYLNWNYAAHPVHFWMTLGAGAVLCVLFATGAAWFVHRAWLDREVRSGKRSDAARRTASRAGLANDPVAWMMLRRRGTGSLVRRIEIAASLTLLGCLTWLSLSNRHASSFELLVLVHLGCIVATLARTAYSFYNDRQEGSLELLLGTPLSNDEIFSGFGRFLLQQSSTLFLMLTAVDVVFAAEQWSRGYTVPAALAVGCAVTLWFTFLGARWLGVYRALMMNHPAGSILTTFARISFVPLTLSALFCWAPGVNYMKVIAFWVISSAILALFFGHDARSKLVCFGRDLLFRPASEKPPHIEDEWSFINWDEVLEEDAPRLSVSGRASLETV